MLSLSRSRPDRDDRRLSFGAYAAGRGGRGEYWIALAIALLFGLLFQRVGEGAGAAVALLYTVRRLHDFGQTGWWSALVVAVVGPVVLAMAVAPILGTLVLAGVAVGVVVFAAFVGLMPGDPNPNRFGDRPPSLLGRKRADLGETVG
jgi:uncharacterized membrane protein YhaH (DUF805 family)